MHVLVTGFAGSLGSAFTKYLCEEGHHVTGIDNNEWAVASFPEYSNLEKKLGDFTSIKGKFDLLIHLAAYKHVDLIESNREESLKNNYSKTEELYDNVEAKILFISTDKAVEPASFYGYSKQMAEELTHRRGGIVARLGNIMGSSGSVIPKWEAAIEKDEPLPITDREMTRYMISADEAVEKIMALFSKAQPGQVIVPEMGEPLKLMDIAQKVLEKHGKADWSDDPTRDYKGYPIRIIGLRPGEKMHEKLKWDWEETVYKDNNGEVVKEKKGATA